MFIINCTVSPPIKPKKPQKDAVNVAELARIELGIIRSKSSSKTGRFKYALKVAT